MIPGKGQILFLLITTFYIVNLKAAEEGGSTKAANVTSQSANVTSQSANVTSQSANVTSQSANVTPQPVNVNQPSTEMKPSTSKPSSHNHMFGSCWSCLFEAVGELCSYLTDWKTPMKTSALNWFSLFDYDSSEESSKGSGGRSSIASLFRFKRSVVEDPAVAQGAFLDLLDGFYVKSRERFVQENPGSIPAIESDNLYNRTDEIAQVVAYVFGVPKEMLVQVFEKLKTRQTGSILLKALADRKADGKTGLLNSKTISGLTPTSISYFFQELLGSMSGVSTGVSEILDIALQNQNKTGKPN